MIPAYNGLSVMNSLILIKPANHPVGRWRTTKDIYVWLAVYPDTYSVMYAFTHDQAHWINWVYGKASGMRVDLRAQTKP